MVRWSELLTQMFLFLCGCGTLKTERYPGGFDRRSFFGLGRFPFADLVWEAVLAHTVNMDAMLGCVSVVWRHVGASIPMLCTWFFFQPN